MRVLTIHQPYASLIANGEKWTENRTWFTEYRGPLAIHAGLYQGRVPKSDREMYSWGSIIAVAEMVACVNHRDCWRQDEAALIPGSKKTWGEFRSHVHAEGPCCFVLENVRRVEPYEITGHQGLWLLPSGVCLVEVG